MNETRRRKITPAQIERAIGVIGTVSESLDISGTDRDHFAVVIYILERAAEQGGVSGSPAATRED